MYTLPIELGEFKSINNDAVVDMSVLNFPTSPKIQKRSSLIFIRNTNLKAHFNFNNCSYEDKEEFLLIYMKGNIDVEIPEILTTWIKILGKPYVNTEIHSFMTDDEIDRFCASNSEFVFEMRRLSISIPLCSIDYYNRRKGNIYENNMPVTKYNGIYMINYIRLLDYDEFIWLIQYINDIEPVFYDFYFNQYNPFFDKIIKKFPYLNMINVMLSNNPDVTDNLTDALSKFLNE